MSELLRVLAEEAVDDDALQEAAAAAHAVLEARGVDADVVPVLHEAAADAGDQAIDDALTDGCPELELIVSPIHGDSRRLRIREAVEPGAAYALQQDEYTGCAWRPVGREQLDRVEIDGDVWHEADATGGQATTRGP